MAKQNFIAGGYYGKLGATVGQRWKNIRTIRAYAVPVNPRTPSQQANRNRFAQAIKAAQTAIQFNNGAPCWANDRITEFMFRTSEAKKRIDAGVTGWLAVPLHPSGVAPSVTVADLQLSQVSGGGWEVTSATVAALPAARRFTICARVFDNVTRTFVDVMAMAQLGAGDGTVFSLPAGSNYTMVDGSLLVGITNDDSDHDGNFVLIAPQTFSPPSSMDITDAGLYFVNGRTLALRSPTMSGLLGTYTLDVSVTLYNPVAGTTVTETQRVTTVQGAENLALVATAGTGTFNSASVASVSMVSASGTSTSLTFSNVQCVTDANTPPLQITIDDVVFTWSRDGRPTFNSAKLAALGGDYVISAAVSMRIDGTSTALSDSGTFTVGNGTGSGSLSQQSAATIFASAAAATVSVSSQSGYPSKLVFSGVATTNNQITVSNYEEFSAVFYSPQDYDPLGIYGFPSDGSIVAYIATVGNNFPAGSEVSFSGTVKIPGTPERTFSSTGTWDWSEFYNGTSLMSMELPLVFLPGEGEGLEFLGDCSARIKFTSTRLNVDIVFDYYIQNMEY